MSDEPIVIAWCKEHNHPLATDAQQAIQESMQHDNPCSSVPKRLVDLDSLVINRVGDEWPDWLEDAEFKDRVHAEMTDLFVRLEPRWNATSATSYRGGEYVPSMVHAVLDALRETQ